jgi:4-alpha-glucanotransferase
VPPDAYAETGQLWGNPLYDWTAMRADGYHWWIERFRRTLELVDLTRLDHFRGFVSYWAVPADDETAEHGRWRRGPGADLFDAVEHELGPLPVVAEDLGVITEPVVRLRTHLGYPGMAVLHFAVGGTADNPHRVENHKEQSVVYTGTHDNDTTLGWYRSASLQMRANVRDYLGIEEHGGAEDVDAMGRVVTRTLIRATFGSVANLAIVPLQDLLELGTAARMNLPGRPDGNWQWRYQAGALTDDLRARLRAITILFARHVPPKARPVRPRRATGRPARSRRATGR